MHHSDSSGLTVVAALLLAAVAGASAAFAGPPNLEESEAVLTVVLRDGLGAPLDARIQATSISGIPVTPVDPEVAVYDAWTGHDYFYGSGSIDLLAPGEPFQLVVSHGPEFAVYCDTVLVSADSTMTVTLNRLFDMKASGFYSGDTHVHVDHGGIGDTYELDNADMALIQRAEDLAFMGVLSNGLYFTGGADPAGDADHVLHFGMEYRSALFGHMGILGLSSLLNFGCCLPDDPPYPMNLEICAQAKDQGALVISSHPTPMDPSQFMIDDVQWPFSGFARELPADVILGGVDAIDVYSYSNFSNAAARDVWFDLLNLGYRPVMSVGTDASMNRDFDPPPGGYRVYARVWSQLGVNTWLAGMKRGESFATNGPLPFYVSIDGRIPGQTFSLTEGPTQQVSVWIYCSTRSPLEYVDVIHNGLILNRHYFPPHDDFLVENFNLNLPVKDGWVVFRLVGDPTDPATVGDPLQALTSPIYLNGPSPEGDPSAVGTFEQWIEDLKTMVTVRPAGTEEQKQSVVRTLETARRGLRGRGRGHDHDDVPNFEEVFSAGAEVRVGSTRGRIRFQLDGRGPATLEVFDIAGRLRHRSQPLDLPLQLDWKPDRGLSSGVYFARVVQHGRTTAAHRFTYLP